MNWKAKLLLALLLTTAVVLIMESLVLEGFLPSTAPRQKISIKSSKAEDKVLRKLFEPRGPQNSFLHQIEYGRNKKTGDGETFSVGFKRKQRNRRPLNGKRLFLIYTPFFGDLPWRGLSTSSGFTRFRGKRCRVTNCSLTYNKDDFLRSDVVIFHARNMPPLQNMTYLHKLRPNGQIWVYFILENPSNTPHAYDFDEMFNWTMSYERKADIYVPYGSYRAIKEDVSHAEPLNAAIKDRLMVWLVSNCGGIRDWYVEKLRNYIRVDVFGNCAGNFYQPDLEEDYCPKNTWECDNIIKRYKFHLSLENGHCVDYLTEKYWGVPLSLGIVPVVLGGANYKELAIPGSYINIMDFPTVQALAEYLLYLDKNDTAYLEYFAWRKKYKVNGCLNGSALNEHYPWTCELCAKAQHAKSNIYKSLSDFRDPSTLCGIHDESIVNILTNSDDISQPSDLTGKGSLTTTEFTEEPEVYPLAPERGWP